MQIRITVPEEMVTLAAKAGLGTEDYVELLLGRIVATRSASEQARDHFRDELLGDWNHYQATGLHLTGEEVDAWLQDLETGKTIDPPPLHT